MIKKTLLQKIASTIQAYRNCLQSGNVEWEHKHQETLEELTKELPHGSGIDGKNEINLKKSDGKKKVRIDSEYHYMDDNGFYAGWFGFSLIFRANLDGYPDIDFKITYNDTELKTSEIDMLFSDYLIESFSYAMQEKSD